MKNEQVVTELTDCGALLAGHFELTSGRHSGRFLQFSVVLQHPPLAERLCAAMAALWRDDGIETVIGPAMGGILVAYETARALQARALFTERDDGRMGLLRGFSLRPGERVLVVDDVLTTGGSLRETVAAVQANRAEVAGVSVLVHRDAGQTMEFGVPYRPLAKVEAVSYPPDACPFCERREPLVDPDRRKA